MRKKRWPLPGTLILVLFLGIALVLVLLGTGAGERLWRPLQLPEVDFSRLQRTGKPNDYLVCLPGACAAAANEPSPRFAVSATELERAWGAMIRLQPRVNRIRGEAGDRQQEFLQQTRWLGFPDSIAVRIDDLPEGGSTLSVYSRSHYGYSDLGTNRRRVRAWLRGLQEQIP